MCVISNFLENSLLVFQFSFYEISQPNKVFLLFLIYKKIENNRYEEKKWITASKYNF